MLFLRLTRARYDRKADSESLDCGVRGRPLGMRGRLLLYRRGRRDARHNAAYHGRRAGRLPAGTLRRRDGTRPRSQGVYVDLRSELAAEPAQPQRDGQRRPPYRLQPASGRQYRRPERRPLRRDGQTAGRSVGVCRQAGRTASRRRFDPRIRRPRKGPCRGGPAGEGRSPRTARLQFDRRAVRGASASKPRSTATCPTANTCRNASA